MGVLNYNSTTCMFPINLFGTRYHNYNDNVHFREFHLPCGWRTTHSTYRLQKNFASLTLLDKQGVK